MANLNKSVGTTLATLPGLIGSAIDGLFKWLDDIDTDVDNKRTTDDGGVMFDAKTGGGHTVRIKVVPTKGYKNFLNVYCLGDNKQKKAYEHISEDKVESVIAEFIDDVYGESLEDFEDMSKTKKDLDVDKAFSSIKITLSKNTKSDELEVHKIYANYDVSSVCEDVETVLQDPEFCNMLCEQPVPYEIIPEADAYQVEPLSDEAAVEFEEFDPMKEASAHLYAFALRYLTYSFKYSSQVGCDELRSQSYHIKYVLEDILDLLSRNPQFGIYEQYDQIIREAFVVDEMLVECDDLCGSHIAEDIAYALDLYKYSYPDEVKGVFEDWAFNLRYKIR